MKAVLVSLLMAVASAAAFGADAPAVAGKWAVHISIAGNEGDLTCTFAPKDDGLTGSCVSDQGTYDVAGKIDGNNVSWSYKSEYNGGPLTLEYKGVINGESMKGSVNVVEYGVDGDFSGVRAKEN